MTSLDIKMFYNKNVTSVYDSIKSNNKNLI